MWSEIWDEIGPRIDSVFETGTATWDESLLLFLERSGYVEETYHTFSYSPLPDDTGATRGMLCVVSEDTERVISERRMATLRELGTDPAMAGSESEVYGAVARQLGKNPRSLPFTLVYRFDGDGAARLVAHTGVVPGDPAAPRAVDLAAAAPWPLGRAMRGEWSVVDLGGVAGIPAGAWPDPPLQALVVPLAAAGATQPYGCLIAGLNRYRPFTGSYRSFVRLVAGQIAAGIANARAYDDERRRAEELAELDEAKTAFFTNVSHELRTPLTLVLGPAEDALADEAAPLPERQRARVELVVRNAHRMLKLVNTLLDFSRLQSGRVHPRYEPTDLDALTAELACMFRPAIERGGLGFRVDCRPLGEPVWGDREMWAKILSNLLSNAVKFTFDGEIAVGLAVDDGAVHLTVSDTGIGIAPADQRRLFERFHRVAGARSRSHEGSGIGLALVAELTAMHGGRVGVSSAPGRGSRFTVSIPLGTAHLPEDAPAGGAAPPDLAPGHGAQLIAEVERWLGGDPASAVAVAGGDRPRILVAEDNADMREYLTSLLAVDYEVEAVPDGAAALAAVRRRPPDLVLTDVMMPELDGFGLLAAIRADPATARVPVIVLSARAGDEGVIEGLQAGADDYLTKPFAARELLARVGSKLELDRVRGARDALERARALLDRSESLAGVGSWELDLETGAVSGSAELLRQLGMTAEELAATGFEQVLATRVHPDDHDLVRRSNADALRGGRVEHEFRFVSADGDVRIYRVLGEALRDESGRVVRLRGSQQDVTGQRRAESAVAAAAGEREAARRERRIAQELQRRLLPSSRRRPAHLDVATYYHAGARDTLVGGDWYDVIELGDGRTALVLGDVMGRGVGAAAVMGQLRAAIRAYAHLELTPADVIRHLDGVLRGLDEDQIATCVYAVHDPERRTLTYANAGHPPPFLVRPSGEVERLAEAAVPPIGSGPFEPREHRLDVGPGAMLVLYSDGLVERRDREMDVGVRLVTEQLRRSRGPEETLAALTDALAAGESSDDVAILVARVTAAAGDPAVSLRLDATPASVRVARAFLAETLGSWRADARLAEDARLVVSELVTNALLHGADPVELRLSRSGDGYRIEVHDGSPALPQRRDPDMADEHGRGLNIVAALTREWGVEETPAGKTVWCSLA